MIDASPIACRDPASFRDPSGFVFRSNGCLLRQVNRSYQRDYDQFMIGGLYDELVEHGLLIPHEEVPPPAGHSREAYKVLRPEQLQLVSYPYEWCFSQLRDAALATLEIQRRALARGMSLKDASAYNLQRHRGRQMLIDTLSFQHYEESRPWVGYRQFCQHFLAPLALACRADLRLLQLLRIHIDGVPLDLASRLLPWRTKWSISLGLHIHAHARSQSKHARHDSLAADAGARLSRRQFNTILSGLQSAIEGLRYNLPATPWSDYYDAKHNYGAAGLKQKERLVRELVQFVQPRTVWDLGANDGRFSRIAAQAGAKTVAAWDFDSTCVEQNYRRAIDENETALHPLILDLANPTPGIGWANAERRSFADRAPADLVMALGLVHHLAISNNVPLDHLASYLAELAPWLLIEWIPKHDSQVGRLLATRPDVFPDYQQPCFEAAFQRYFQLVRTAPIEGTARTLYLLKASN